MSLRAKVNLQPINPAQDVARKKKTREKAVVDFQQANFDRLLSDSSFIGIFCFLLVLFSYFFS